MEAEQLTLLSHKQKNIILTILTILVIILIILLVRTHASSSKNTNVVNTPTPTTTQVETYTSPTPVIYEISQQEVASYVTKSINMDANSSADITLTIKIPSSWSLDESSSNTINSNDYFVDFSEYPLHVSGSSIDIHVDEDLISPNEKIDDMYQSPYGPIIGKVRMVVINETPIIFFNYESEGSSSSYTFQFIHNQSKYNLRLHTPEEPPYTYVARDIQVIWFIIDQLTK